MIFQFAQQNMNRQFALMRSQACYQLHFFMAIVHRRLMNNLDISIVFKILLQCFQLERRSREIVSCCRASFLKVQNRSLVINRDTAKLDGVGRKDGQVLNSRRELN